MTITVDDGSGTRDIHLLASAAGSWPTGPGRRSHGTKSFETARVFLSHVVVALEPFWAVLDASTTCSGCILSWRHR